MSHDIRNGDTIISRFGQLFTVRSHGVDGRVKASALDHRRKKTFRPPELECVDPDDGVWQEMATDD